MPSLKEYNKSKDLFDRYSDFAASYLKQGQTDEGTKWVPYLKELLGQLKADADVSNEGQQTFYHSCEVKLETLEKSAPKARTKKPRKLLGK